MDAKNNLPPFLPWPGAGSFYIACMMLLVSGVSPSIAASDQGNQQINSQINRLYQAGRLDEALTKVNFLLKSEPNSGAMHYYKGNILAKAGRVQEAKAEYEKAIACKPLPAIAGYCIEALRAIDAPVTNGVITTLRGQTLTTEQKLQQDAYATANNVRQKAIAEANAINGQTQATVASMQKAGYYDASRQWIPTYTPQDIARAQQEGTTKAANALADGDRSSQAVVNEAQRRAQAMEDSSQNLEDQLNNRFSNKNVHLDSHGTNLYVRHYLPETISQTPLKAKQEVGQFQDPLSASRQGLSINRSFGQAEKNGRATTAVSGELLRPEQAPAATPAATPANVGR